MLTKEEGEHQEPDQPNNLASAEAPYEKPLLEKEGKEAAALASSEQEPSPAKAPPDKRKEAHKASSSQSVSGEARGSYFLKRRERPTAQSHIPPVAHPASQHQIMYAQQMTQFHPQQQAWLLQQQAWAAQQPMYGFQPMVGHLYMNTLPPQVQSRQHRGDRHNASS